MSEREERKRERESPGKPGRREEDQKKEEEADCVRGA